MLAALRLQAAPFAWGFNDRGQIGDNSVVNRLTPVAMAPSGMWQGRTIAAMDAGGYHSVAFTFNNELYAWGYNNFGQLGNGSNSNRLEPVPVVMTGVLAGKAVTAIAAGTHHTLALTSEGRVYSWGHNDDGALGNGTRDSRNVPGAVSVSGALAGKAVTAIATGYQQCLVLTSDGALFSWGLNAQGQLGDGSNTTRTLPVAVVTTGVLLGKTITRIAAGRDHCMVLTSDGKLFAWGKNDYGQLGDGTLTNRNVPVAVNMSGVLAGRFVASMDGGYSHTAAVTTDGRMFAWGRNDQGALGDGTLTNRLLPVAVVAGAVPPGTQVTSVQCGRDHSLALTAAGKIYAWGRNDNGQLGDGSAELKTIPAAVTMSGVLAGRSVSAISTGYDHNFALAGTTLENWRLSHFGTSANSGLSANNADPDKDGLENLVEFAFGLNPNTPDATALPEWQREDDDYSLTFIRPAGVDGITYIAEYSPDMDSGSWTPAMNVSSPPAYQFYAPAIAQRQYVRVRVTAP
jgi:alpha-tubulin suppressor-like RCC1 family protein